MLKPILSQRRAPLVAALFVLLASIYTMSYSSAIESGDSRRLVDAVSSFVDYRDSYLDQASLMFPPQTFNDSLVYPLQDADIEPLQVILAAPLYLVARVVPGIGLVQTLYLFNVIVVATAGCLLFLYALTLGYSEGTAALATLAFGIATAVFPYTKSFFREPLVLLMLLLCGWLIERLRVSSYRSFLLLIAVILALLGVLLTKASALLALPALLVITLPSVKSESAQRAILTLGLIVLLVAGLFILLSSASVFGNRYNLLNLLSPGSASYLVPALHAYLISIGGSIWGTSPIVLLALPGMWLMLRRGQLRYPLAIVLLVGAFAVGYAALNGLHWFGGLSWPPRFLIPVLPFLILGALPVFERMTKSRGWLLLGVVLLIYSVWVQLSGVALSWQEYPRALPPEAGGLLEWEPGLNDPAYLRWTIIPQLWQRIPLDVAWLIINMPGVLIVFAGLVLAALGWLIALLRGRAWRGFGIILPALLLLNTGIGLRLLYANDPRYLAGDETLYAMLPILEAETEPDDVILLSSPRYEPFFSNAAKLNDAGRIIVLPLQPGEQPSPEQKPEIRSDNPMLLLTTSTIRLIYNLAATRDRLWLLVNAGPDVPWSVRPVERFMDSHYYRTGSVIQTGPLTRLIEYSTINAPDPFAFRLPERVSELEFDGHIRLTGFDLPLGVDYRSGDVLPLTTTWTTNAPLEGNYSIGVYLRDAAGAEIAQVDSQPGGGFFPTSQWQTGVTVWDNRAIQLPDALASGTYQLWVKLYDFGADGSVQDLPVSAGERINDNIGVLEVTINVQS
jgi:hypothetical protein